MKEKIKTFVAKNRLTLLIAFCIVGTLFTQPLTVYRGDSNYFWYRSHSFNPFGSGWAFAEFLVEPDQDIEIIGFTDTSSIAANGSVGWNDGNREFRATTEQIYADRLENEPNLTPRVQILCGVQEGICKHSPLYMN